MKRILPIALALFVVLGMSYSAEAKKRYVFGGGPAGGTFQVVANAVQVYDPIKDNPDFSIKAQSSGGSTENLRTVNAGRVQFGTVYAGLTNDETSVCSGLMTIPTSREGTSLNLAQAVVVVLYECFKRALDAPFTPNGPPTERATTVQEQEALFENLRESLLAIDFLKGDNPDYWMLPVRRFFAKINLRRNEFNLLMGVCRQIQWFVTKYGPDRK